MDIEAIKALHLIAIPLRSIAIRLCSTFTTARCVRYALVSSQLVGVRKRMSGQSHLERGVTK